MNEIEAHNLNNDLSLIKLCIETVLKVNLDTDISILLKKALCRLECTIEGISENYGDNRMDLIRLARTTLPDLCNNLSLELDLEIDKSIFPKISKKSFRESATNVIKNARENNATKIKFFLSGSCFSFTDNGSGFDTNVLKKLNSGEFVTTKKLGSGIGVQSLKKFCVENNLELILDNTNEGASVSFILKE